MNIENSIGDDLKITIRTCFEDWLDENFGLRLHLKNGQLKILEAVDSQSKNTKHLVYNPPHFERYTRSGPSIFPGFWEVLDAPLYDGEKRMKEVVAKHDLLLDFDVDSVFITCNKLWCKGRKFELRLEEIGGNANRPKEFVVHGLNRWKLFPEKPEGFDNDHIREYILHRMLQL